MELKPCPFCGSKADGPHTNDDYSWIECSNAACSIFMELPNPVEFVIMAWNQRTKIAESFNEI